MKWFCKANAESSATQSSVPAKAPSKKETYVRLIAGISLAVLLAAVILSVFFPGSYQSALDDFLALKLSGQANLFPDLAPEEFWAYAAAQDNSSISEAKAAAYQLFSHLSFNPDFPAQHSVTGESQYKGAKLEMIKEYLDEVYGIKPYWVRDCRKVGVLEVTAEHSESDEPCYSQYTYDLILIRSKWYVTRCTFDEDGTSVSVKFFPDWILWYEPAYY